MHKSNTKIHIGNIIRDAVQSDFKNWSVNPMKTASLPQTVNRLFTLLSDRQIDYVLVGGIALFTYVEGRNTEDIDLIIAVSSLAQMPEIQIASQDMYLARGQFEELKIEIFLTSNPLFDKVRRKYTTIQHFVEQDIPTANVEGLLLLKLYALPSLYRQGSFSQVGIYENDIATLLFDYQPDLKTLYVELAGHLNERDINEAQTIVTEIQQRIDRFRKSAAS